MTINYKIIRVLFITTAVSLFIHACGGGGSGDTNSSTNTPKGKMSVRVTDAPIDGVDVKVFVQFSAIELHGSGKTTRIEYDPPKQIELTLLTEGKTADFINDLELPAGRYQWMRLEVDTAQDLDTYISVNGTPYELSIPSEERSGLKIVSEFEVIENKGSIYVIDFDLRKSITVTVNGLNVNYKLRPTLRLLEEKLVGVIAGTVDLANYACDETGNAVYIYDGANQLADDEGSLNPPVTSAQIKYNTETATYKYLAAFVNQGDYTVALTCMADADNPETNDDITFLETHNASVKKGETTLINFPN